MVLYHPPYAVKTLLLKVCPHAWKYKDEPPISKHKEGAWNHEDIWLSNHREAATLRRGHPRCDVLLTRPSSSSAVTVLFPCRVIFYVFLLHLRLLPSDESFLLQVPEPWEHSATGEGRKYVSAWSPRFRNTKGMWMGWRVLFSPARAIQTLQPFLRSLFWQQVDSHRKKYFV